VLPDLIVGILITEKWGFVLLHSANRLYLYNLNGTEIHSVPLASPIVRWTAWSSVIGFDYAAYANAADEVIAFEVFYLGKRKSLGISRDVVCLQFHASSQRLIVVTADGQLKAVPCRFDSN
jgi:hypothetical protein